MASRSRHLTRDDASGRFSPLTTAEQRELGEQVLQSVRDVQRPVPPGVVPHIPVFGFREAAPWFGIVGIGGT